MSATRVMDTILQRRNYPILGIHQDSEIKYAEEVLKVSEGVALLMFPVGVLIGSSRLAHQLRGIMFDDWNIVGIFDIGSIFEPATTIRFSLVILTKQKNPEVYFGTFSGNVFSSIPRHDCEIGILGEFPKPSSEFKSYIDSIDAIIEKGDLPKSTSSYRFFSVKAKSFDKEHLNIEYYNPDLVANEKWIRSEKWVSLSSVAEVYMPRSTQNPARNLYPKFFSYPLSKEIPVSEKGTNIVLQKGDILIASIDFRKAYLVHENPPFKDLRPSPTFFVIRPRSELVTSYYLFLYLQSDTARKYAARYKTGTIFQRVNLKDLRDFPIVLPDLATQEYSRSVFERMFLESGSNQLDLVNDLLFSKKTISEKQIQREFVLEELETVRLHKKELISRLLKDDFTEINHCFSVSAYKSTLILCGSILEAILLDWISEIDQCNYFEEEKEPRLSEVIKKLQNQLGDAKEQAMRIKDKRNLVHPRRLLRNIEKIDRQMCESAISDLRVVLKQRGLDTH
ncbi:MAG: restriction endonuclease subunit S [Anaerolineales bacterium]|nr:restriction endonuclease subunit S [Anaerolineales bacterium]